MKKTNLIKSILMVACCVFFMAGCQNNAVADDGTDIRDYSKIDTGSGDSGSGGGGSGGSGWALCKNSGYDIFDMQVWKGADTLDYTPQDGYGHFAYTKGSAGWTGGGLVRAGANVPGGESIPSFNMAGTKKMTFDIRGNINPQTLVLAIQNRTQIGASDVVPSKTPIKTLGNVSSLSETDWKSVTIDFSSSTADDIINAFCIIIAGDWGGTTTDSWFDIKNLDWIDSTGKSVTLSIKN